MASERIFFFWMRNCSASAARGCSRLRVGLACSRPLTDPLTLFAHMLAPPIGVRGYNITTSPPYWRYVFMCRAGCQDLTLTAAATTLWCRACDIVCYFPEPELFAGDGSSGGGGGSCQWQKQMRWGCGVEGSGVFRREGVPAEPSPPVERCSCDPSQPPGARASAAQSAEAPITRRPLRKHGRHWTIAKSPHMGKAYKAGTSRPCAQSSSARTRAQ